MGRMINFINNIDDYINFCLSEAGISTADILPALVSEIDNNRTNN